jgi:WD40 repeat protein
MVISDLKGHQSGVVCLAFSPSKFTITSSSSTSGETAVGKINERRKNDPEYLVSVGKNDGIIVWNWRKGEVISFSRVLSMVLFIYFFLICLFYFIFFFCLENKLCFIFANFIFVRYWWSTTFKVLDYS